MPNKKAIFAVGTIFLFFIVAMSPLLIKQTKSELEPEALLTRVVFGSDSVTEEDLVLPESEETTFKTKISEFMDSLDSVNDYTELLATIQDFFGEKQTSTLLKDAFQNIDGFSLFSKRVFVISYGHNPTVSLFRKFQFNLFRPAMLFWYYTGNSQHYISDKTLIIDPYPFDVRMFDGRQMGFMKRFVGVYIYKPSGTVADSYTFFIGYAYKVAGIDLSYTN
jgi:hypothetical protein